MAEALIIIDMMQGYMKDTENPRKVIHNIVKLIKQFRKSGKKIIFSQPKFNSRRKNPVMLNLWGDEEKEIDGVKDLVKEIANIKPDKLIEKYEYSSFYKTDLEKYCRKNNITELYLTGVFSGCCVYFTGVDAAYRMIQPILVKDATGTPKKNLTDSNWNKRTQDNFKLMIGNVMTTKQVLAKISK